MCKECGVGAAEPRETYEPPPLYSDKTQYWLARVGFTLLYTHYAALGAAIAGVVTGLVAGNLDLVWYALWLLFFAFAMLVLVTPTAVYYSWHAIKRRYGWLGPR
jgi:hypothetical protein